ncbi:hypothetical protein [Sphingomonas asaccharolytica]|uniref:hypothetical protein n=1 Tax=Sphingomonas asaccharolytica TaxID=40681 RepID=UPI00082BC1D0|nr:hypothetical protein [Sphingomonas asaccharolytica]
MRNLRLSFVLLVARYGCSGSQSAITNCADAAKPALVIEKCFGGNLQTGHYLGDVACFPFSEPQRFTGIWHVELEGSFFEAPSANGIHPRNVWLDVANPPKVAQASMQGDAPRDFAVDLIGRRSLCAGMFGHMGVIPHEITVETLTSIRQVR